MILGSKVQEDAPGSAETVAVQIPPAIRNMFDEDLVLTAAKRLLVTLGQFSIVRLERDVQIIVPLVEYAIPTKECTDGGACCPEDPCEIFSQIPFPASDFAPTCCQDEPQACSQRYQTSGE